MFGWPSESMLLKVVFDLVLNSSTPLVFRAHAARALEDLTGRIAEFKNKKQINKKKFII